MRKSTGIGGLAIWPHFMQDIQWIEEYSSPSYKGPAVKAHASVTVGQMYEEAAKRNPVIVGCSCTSVGFTRGYIQGGGTSTLSSFLGMGIDSVVDYEVITTKGEMVIASPKQNEDLYLALSGGGGGTCGIV